MFFSHSPDPFISVLMYIAAILETLILFGHNNVSGTAVIICASYHYSASSVIYCVLVNSAGIPSGSPI